MSSFATFTLEATIGTAGGPVTSSVKTRIADSATRIFESLFLRLHFPKHVHNHPLAIRLRDVKVVDPISSYRLHTRRVPKDVEDCDVLLLFVFRRILAAASSRVLH